MYIDGFVVGVFVTLFIEMGIYITRDVVRKSRNNNKKHIQGGK